MKLVEKVKAESLVEASIKLLVMRVAGVALFEVVEGVILVELVVAEVVESLKVSIRDVVTVVVVVLGEESMVIVVLGVTGEALFEVVEEAIFVKLLVAEKVIVSLEVLIRDVVIVVLGEE